MNVRRRASLLVVFGLIALLGALAALLLPGRRDTAPDVTFTLLDGRTQALSALRGRPVLVSFWATSCAPCIEELPDLVRLYRELKPKGFELIAVAMPYDPPLHVQDFVRRHDVPYPVALDVSGAAARAFEKVEFIPIAFLIDPGGEIVLRHIGKLDIERVRKRVAAFPSAGGEAATPAS